MCKTWDRFEPGQSLVWLVPSTKWPAYDQGKIFVQNEPDGSLLIGVYVEKGYSGDVATALGMDATIPPDAYRVTGRNCVYDYQGLRGANRRFWGGPQRGTAMAPLIGSLVSVPKEDGDTRVFPRFKEAGHLRTWRSSCRPMPRRAGTGWTCRIGMSLIKACCKAKASHATESSVLRGEASLLCL